MEWVYVRDELPPEGKEVFIIRGWDGGEKHPRKASRKSNQPLTLDADLSKNCWWHDDDRGYRFSDGTVVAWLKIPDVVAPPFEGVLYDFHVKPE